MASMIPLDCILVGYNDCDFEAFSSTQKKLEQHSGAYHEIKSNSIIWHGKRTPYMDLINQAITSATGRNPNLNVFEAPLQALCYLSSYLKKRGFAVDMVNFFNHDKEKFRTLLSAAPRAVAITTTFYVDDAPIIELVGFIRKHSPTTKIILGGPHVFNLALDHDQDTHEYIFEAVIGADIYIIDSQGEDTLSKVLERLRGDDPLDTVPNLYFRGEDGNFHRTPRIIENNDLNQNSIDWTSFNKDLVSDIAYVRTARSCPYKCSFCNYPTMAGDYVNSSLEVVESELRTLHQMRVTDIVFIDDTFNYPIQRFKRLLRMMIENRFNFRWVSFLRCSNVDEEALDLMKESGCIGVLLGIESGDQRILQLMNKSAKVERYRWGISELNKRDIVSFASLICGFPGETEESVNNTIAFIEESKPTFFNVQLYYHDTRAPIQKKAEALGIHGAGYSWSHNTMDWKGAAALAEYMFRSIENSIPLSLYGFSLWGISYLVSRGISMELIKEFGRITRPMLLGSFTDDFSATFKAEEERLLLLFQSSYPPAGREVEYQYAAARQGPS
jgi:radical SAM PhpK family P-methyltransferase